jgi:carboxylesterase type B
MRVLIRAALVVVFALPAATGLAQRAVDPSKVKPEYREAAEKRAAEQRKLAVCQKEADAKKLTTRDRTKFLGDCIDR